MKFRILSGLLALVLLFSGCNTAPKTPAPALQEDTQPIAFSEPRAASSAQDVLENLTNLSPIPDTAVAEESPARRQNTALLAGDCLYILNNSEFKILRADGQEELSNTV
ncbi:MAG: hypothetical protein LBM28_05585 [Oscillospiraceae bacterium]|jgi:hypothetical protein|nr:hypothetical protein [Oscillospiraceae bacterium]